MTAKPLCLLAALLNAGSLLTANDFQASVRIGATPVIGNEGPEASRTGFLISGELAWVKGQSTWFTSFDIHTMNSNAREVTQFGRGYYRNEAGTLLTGLVTPYGIGGDGLPNPNSDYDSVDIRRDQMGGFAISLGYRFRLSPDSPFSVHGGLKLAKIKASQEVSAALKVVTNRNTPSNADPVGKEDVYDKFSKTCIKPGVFLGVRMQMNEVVFAEVNTTFLTYTSINYVPFTYTGQSAHLETRNRTKALLECSVGFRF